jgi:hypothetical protein
VRGSLPKMEFEWGVIIRKEGPKAESREWTFYYVGVPKNRERNTNLVSGWCNMHVFGSVL